MNNFPVVSYERLPQWIGPERQRMIAIAQQCQEERRRDPSKLDIGRKAMRGLFLTWFGAKDRQLFGEYLNERVAPELVVGMAKGFRQRVLVALENSHPGKVFTPNRNQLTKALYDYDIWYEKNRLRNLQEGYHADSGIILHDSIHCTMRQYLKRPPYPAYLTGPREVSDEFHHDVKTYGPSLAKLMHDETLEEELFVALWGGIENPVFPSLVNHLRKNDKVAKRILTLLNLPISTAVEGLSDEQLFKAYLLLNKDYLIGSFRAAVERLIDESKPDSIQDDAKAKQRTRVDQLIAHPPAALRPLFNVMLRKQFNPKTRRLNHTPSLFRLWKSIAQGRCNVDTIESLYPEVA